MKKNVLTTLLYGIIIVGSIVFVSCFNLFHEINGNHSYVYSEILRDDLSLFTMQKAMELNPDYEPIEVKGVSKDLEKVLRENFHNLMKDYTSSLENDPSFIYSIKDRDTKKEVNHLTLIEDNPKNHFYYQHTFEKGSWIDRGDSNDALWYHQDQLRDLLMGYMRDGLMMEEYDEETETFEYVILDEVIRLENIQFNFPENIEYTFIIPEEIDENSVFYDFIRSYIDDRYMVIFVIFFIVMSILLALVVLASPYEVLKTIQPFKLIEPWYFEILFITLSACIACGCAGSTFLGCYSIAGYFDTMLPFSNIQIPPIMIFIVNVLALSITLFFIVVALFIIKSFIIQPKKYLKENIFCVRFVYKFIEYANILTQWDLSKSYIRTILFFIVAQFGIICLMISFRGFGLVLAGIYSVCLLFFVRYKLSEIQGDYNALVESAKQLGQGNFNQKVEDDLHLFNEMKDAFNSIYDGFERAVEEETKSQNMKTELISNVSHDLKTPLTCIKNYVTLLQDENLDEEARKEYLSNLNMYSNRLNNLLQDLLQISKVNSGNIELNPMELNIISLLNQVIFENEDLMKEKDLSIIKNFDEEEITLYLDGQKTYRIFENLLVNISKYALPHSRVYLDVFEYDDTVEIVFKNISENPMNFTPEEIEERFVRGDKSRHETGSGLGLAIVKSFTEIQEGVFTIQIEGDLFKTIVLFHKH